MLKQPKTLQEVIDEMQKDIDILNKEITLKEEEINKLILIKLYLENILKKEG